VALEIQAAPQAMAATPFLATLPLPAAVVGVAPVHRLVALEALAVEKPVMELRQDQELPVKAIVAERILIHPVMLPQAAVVGRVLLEAQAYWMFLRGMAGPVSLLPWQGKHFNMQAAVAVDMDARLLGLCLEAELAQQVAEMVQA
jgi:hypothetical protein